MPRSLRACSSGFFLFALISLAGCTAMVPGDVDAAQLGDAPPAIAVREPSTNLTVAQGESFTVRWEDSDVDSNADISILLFPVIGSGAPIFIAALTEDDGPGGDPDLVDVDTSTLEPGGYHVLVTISDGVNPGVSLFALRETGDRAVVAVVEVDR